jgi:hypothetical protein
MRGVFSDQGRLFSYISPEARVPANHPLRKIRKLVRDVLGELNRSLAVARLATRSSVTSTRPRAPCRSIRRIILCASHGALFSISGPLPHRGYRLVLEI